MLIGKSCMINCFKYGSIEWKKANETLESVLELGNNIKQLEIIQAPTIYPTDDGNYKVLTGHRRYFAMVFANGYDSAAQFKVYNRKPLLHKTKQFQENASRDDLPQYGKLMSFTNALQELELLNQTKVAMGEKS